MQENRVPGTAQKKTKQGRYKRIDVVTFPTHISGVYTIINRVSGKQYIGQSTCINDRISKHRSLLSMGLHHPSIQLQHDDYNLGPEAFDVGILEKVPDKKMLRQRENYWISAYKVTELYNTVRDHQRATRAHKRKQYDEQYIQGSLFDFIN
ncbi:GIY-YIG nuclease family protein [Laceyella putida]|uniref:GIY-YIG nuclease family protein n=1 Tax=Laceyella putida TaxID=110101 RepID=A0ABW2RL00_9BACL